MASSQIVEFVTIALGTALGSFLLLVAHEFAHAVPVLLAGGRVHVTIGSHDGRTGSVGPLTVTVGYDGVRKLLIYGSVSYDGVDSRRVRAAGIAAGPIVSVVAVLVMGVALWRDVLGELPATITTYLLLFETYRVYQTAVPRTYGQGPYEGRPSDGKLFLQTVRE